MALRRRFRRSSARRGARRPSSARSSSSSSSSSSSCSARLSSRSSSSSAPAPRSVRASRMAFARLDPRPWFPRRVWARRRRRARAIRAAASGARGRRRGSPGRAGGGSWSGCEKRREKLAGRGRRGIGERTPGGRVGAHRAHLDGLDRVRVAIVHRRAEPRRVRNERHEHARGVHRRVASVSRVVGVGVRGRRAPSGGVDARRHLSRPARRWERERGGARALGGAPRSDATRRRERRVLATTTRRRHSWRGFEINTLAGVPTLLVTS